MRFWIILLLILPASFAFIVESSDIIGNNPIMYAELVAYERDGEIHVYDIKRDEVSSFGKGQNPYLFAYTVVFETKESDVDLNNDGDLEDTVIQYANVRDKKIVSTNAVGRHASVYADFIVFSTKESELGVDFTNDGDDSDDLIRFYDMKSEEVVNTKAVGDYPVLNQHFIVFQTDESQVNTDLNADGDKADQVINVYDRDDKQVTNVPIAGLKPRMTKDSNAVFVSNNKVVVLDVREKKIIETNQSGTSPSISGDIVVFIQEGNVMGWSLATKTAAKTDIIADKISVFEDRAAITSHENFIGDVNGDGELTMIIRHIRNEDIDGDDITDFIDNCATIPDVNQTDSDNDGIGDLCDETPPPPKSTPPPTQKEIPEPPTPEPFTSASEMTVTGNKVSGWVWIVIIILLIPAGYYGYKHYKKKQKSFGF